MEKMTKAMYFAGLRELVVNYVEDAETAEKYTTWIDEQVALLDKRKESARARAEKKKAESDELTEAIYGVLDENFVTADAITEAVAGEGVTKSKVVARLTKLVKAERVEKSEIKIEGVGKRVAYRIAPETEVEAEEATEE